MVGPVSRNVLPTNQYSLVMPIVKGPNFGGCIAHGESASAAFGLVGLGTVKEQVAVHGELTRAEGDVDGDLPVAFGVLDDQIENFAFVVGLLVTDGTVEVGPRKKTHIGVFRVRIVDG